MACAARPTSSSRSPPLFTRREAHLVEPNGFRLRETTIGELAQRVAPHRASASSMRPSASNTSNRGGVVIVGRDGEAVAGFVGDQGAVV